MLVDGCVLLCFGLAFGACCFGVCESIVIFVFRCLLFFFVVCCLLVSVGFVVCLHIVECCLFECYLLFVATC